MVKFCRKIAIIMPWKVCFKRTATYFLLIYFFHQMLTSLYEVTKNFQDNLFSTVKLYRFRKLYNLENFQADYSEDSFISNKYIQDMCYGSSITSSFKNITNHTVRLPFEPITKYYEETSLDSLCYKKGSKIFSNASKCDCLQNYFGTDCGFPAAVWNSYKFHVIEGDVKLRKVPKRVINGFLFNHEFVMLEARIHELKDVVDIFVILETEYTSFGENKPLRLKERFQKGYLSKFRNKILHIILSTKIDFQQLSGPDVDHLMRCILSNQGLNRIKGILDDDIFILSDADEIPAADVVAFLKLYDGIPEVAKLVFKWNIYGFFWQATDESLEVKTTDVFAVASLRVLKHKFKWNSYYLRNENAKGEDFIIIGNKEYVSGWHCSWCFSPKGIVMKMNAAHQGDQPRLGDDPEKKDLKFISECIKNGTYFYDAPPFKGGHLGDYMYAPRYLIEHFDKYKNLLQLQ